MLNSFQHPSCRIAGAGVRERTKPHGRSRPAGTGWEAKWTLKRVQGDGAGAEYAWPGINLIRDNAYLTKMHLEGLTRCVLYVNTSNGNYST